MCYFNTNAFPNKICSVCLEKIGMVCYKKNNCNSIDIEKIKNKHTKEVEDLLNFGTHIVTDYGFRIEPQDIVIHKGKVYIMKEIGEVK